ncbi:hypothetical protein C4D60_Mb10t28980 [Musa balbisiana]|uniref:Arabinogalactan peptide 22 n=1 Tax=Musa balbisiana TaxID=52838 RepID=A0A4S8J0J7_MUSBA|nr:hypothetical protein C4D60_Mb10t28980 [Musa balbisiana]
MSSMRVCTTLGFAAFILSGLMQIPHGEATAPARKIDGKAIDQGIAYVLMLLALLVTYILH